jgi:hypothetical protein
MSIRLHAVRDSSPRTRGGRVNSKFNAQKRKLYESTWDSTQTAAQTAACGSMDGTVKSATAQAADSTGGSTITAFQDRMTPGKLTAGLKDALADYGILCGLRFCTHFGYTPHPRHAETKGVHVSLLRRVVQSRERRQDHLRCNFTDSPNSSHQFSRWQTG